MLAAGLVACILSANASGGRADPATIPFGDLVLTYDPADWFVTARENGFDAACLARDCRGASLAARSSPGATDLCQVEAAPARSGGRAARSRRFRAETLALPDLTILVAWTDIGCRNLRPPVIEACTFHGGQVYRFDTGPGHCRGGPVTGLTDVVLRLLRGLRTR